jgi:nucleotide-binding universal stress UspA family protein
MTVNRILYPTDLSTCSLVALDYAADLAASCQAELHILYVDDLRDPVAVAADSAPSFVASSPPIKLKKQLEALKPTLTNASCQYTTSWE